MRGKYITANSKLSNNYIDNCTFVRTVLMMSVVLGHSVNFWKGNWFTKVEPAFNSSILVVISDLVNSFHIYAFVLVSGYIYAYLRIQKGKYLDFVPFVWNKIKRLIIPFIFTCIIWVGPIGCYFNNYSLQECLNNYILGISPNQLWFLLMLFWCFVFAWPLSKLFKNYSILSLLIVAVFYVGGIVGSRFLSNYYSIWTGCEYLLYFWLGFQIFNYKKIVISISVYVWVISFFASFILDYMFIFCSLITSLLQAMIHILGALMAFFVLQKIASKISWKNSKSFMALAKTSMAIYLFHQQIIYFTILFLNGKVNPYVHAFVNFIVAMMASYGLSCVLMRFKITRFLIGEK